MESRVSSQFHLHGLLAIINIKWDDKITYKKSCSIIKAPKLKQAFLFLSYARLSLNGHGKLTMKYTRSGCVWKGSRGIVNSLVNVVNRISFYFDSLSLVFQSVMPKFRSNLAFAKLMPGT